MVRQYTLFSLFFALALTVSCGDRNASDTAEPKAINEVTGDAEIDKISAKIEERPGDLDLYMQRGTLYMGRNLHKEAIRDFTLALELDSERPEVYKALADAYLANNMSYDALEVMKDAYSTFPDSVHIGLKLAEYHLILKQYLAAMNLTNSILENNPGMADAHLFQGIVYREMETPQKAMESLQNAVELDATLTDAWIMMAEMIAKEDMQMARRFYENAERSAPLKVAPTHSYALFLHQNDFPEEALKKYKEAHVKDPSASKTFYNAGLLYLELDSLTKAAEMLDIAIGNAPTFAKAYYYRGMAAEWQEDWSTALENYQRADQLGLDESDLGDRMRNAKAQLDTLAN
jgi:tetratricopeptide (TPR) repeat protein